jgi:hypothetical protein
VSIPALFVVDVEGDDLTFRRGTRAFLHERSPSLALDRDCETAANGVLSLTDGKRGCGPALNLDRAQTESVVGCI